VESVLPEDGHFKVETNRGDAFTASFILLCIGRRGTPRKLGVPGENMEKVAYRLIEAETIEDKDVIIVGGGDSAVESALLLSISNRVILSYRNDAFSRLKPKNLEKIRAAMSDKSVDVRFNTTVLEIAQEHVSMSSVKDPTKTDTVKNDLVYIFAGGELPTQFLQKIGIEVSTKFGEAILKHDD
jgi:thioredoxin reductase (NADPH)